MPRAEDTFKNTVIRLDSDVRHIQERLVTLDDNAKEVHQLAQRIATLEGAGKGQASTQGKDTLLWMKIGVVVSAVLGAIGIFLHFL